MLLMAVPAAVETLEAVGVTNIATDIETVVRILYRPANLVSSNCKPGCCQVAVDSTSLKSDLQAVQCMLCTCLLGLIAVAK